MKLIVRLSGLLFVGSTLSFAGSWTGFLVNSKCYDSLERNKNPTDTENYVDRDKNSEIRYCRPNAKTKLFAVVMENGLSFKLDSGGNAKAAQLMSKPSKQSSFEVSITGEMKADTVKVESISLNK